MLLCTEHSVKQYPDFGFYLRQTIYICSLMSIKVNPSKSLSQARQEQYK